MFIALEVGDRVGEGQAYGNLARAYKCLGQLEKAVEFYQKYLKHQDGGCERNHCKHATV